MTIKVREEEVHYPVLLFIVMTGLATTRGVVNAALSGFGRDGPWIFFVCLIAVLGGVWVSLQVSGRYRGQSIMMACGLVGPKALTPVSYLLYAILFWGGALYSLMISGDFFARTLLYGDSSPLMITGALLATLTALFSMETIGRYGHLLMLFIIPLYMIASLTALKNARWSMLLPIFQPQQWTAPVQGVSGAIIMFIPLAAVTMLANRNTRGGLFVSISVLSLVSAIFGAYIVTMGITTFGPLAAQQFTFLTHAVLGTVRVENSVLERIVFLQILLWKYLEVAASSFFIRCAAFCIAQTFGWKLSPLHVIAVGLASTVFVSMADRPFMFAAFSYGLGCYGLAMLVAFPVCMYIWMLLRRRTQHE